MDIVEPKYSVLNSEVSSLIDPLSFNSNQQALQSSQEEGGLSSTFNRRPLRAYHREFRQVVEMADVILEVLDARDPLGTRCVEVEQAVMAASSGKKLVLVLNKIGN